MRINKPVQRIYNLYFIISKKKKETKMIEENVLLKEL